MSVCVCVCFMQLSTINQFIVLLFSNLSSLPPQLYSFFLLCDLSHVTVRGFRSLVEG